MLQLRAPERTIEQLRALAASGSSRFARKAQAELRARVKDALTAVREQQPTSPADGSR